MSTCPRVFLYRYLREIFSGQAIVFMAEMTKNDKAFKKLSKIVKKLFFLYCILINKILKT